MLLKMGARKHVAPTHLQVMLSFGNLLTLFDMGFFEPSVMGGGGHEAPPS